MNTLIISPLEIVEGALMRYELPPEGITLLGYIVRRMHKTSLLLPIREMAALGQHVQALCQVAHYAIASSVSFGQLYYEPRRDHVGVTVREPDPQTNVLVKATLENITPAQRLSYTAELPNGDCFTGLETSEASTIDLRGWVLPALTCFRFCTADQAYRAKVRGKILREVVPRLAGPWHIRAHGTLALEDNQGNSGQVQLERNAKAKILINKPTTDTVFQHTLDLS